ncbi:MAG: dialkylresorcinol condensing enzyme DarA [Bacteroidales bacterium]|nr:dialkylresorcinol condensing enzyme DarA [Bacteroidales bacterium]
MKKILIAYYTQSGQIKEILDQYTQPFLNSQEYELHYHQILPVNDFPFPWNSEQFFDVFPEAVTEAGCELQPMPKELIQEYDLIILGLQVWYLSPSIPITAFLTSNDFESIAKNTPIITINGCRNMWFMAHRSLIKYLEQAQAKHLGHLVLFDKVNNLISVVTIMYWAYNAKKDSLWGIFPKPGITDHDIKGAKKYGEQLKEFWERDELNKLQTQYIKSGGVQVLPHMMSMEHKAKRIFKIWTQFVLKKGGSKNPERAFRLSLFKYYLFFMIYLLSPIATLVFYLSYPLFYKRIQKNINWYQNVK